MSHRFIRASRGNFLINNPIDLAHDTLIEGAGKRNSTIKLADGVNQYMFTNTDGFNHGYLGRFGVDGNKANNATVAYGLYIRGAWWAHLEQLYITNCHGDGLRMTSNDGGIYCGECFLEDIYSYLNDGMGYNFGAFGDGLVIDCYCDSCLGVGFHFAGSHCDSFHLHPCRSGSYGIQVDASAKHMGIISPCLDTNGKHGLYLLGSNSRVVGAYALGNGTATPGTYDGIRLKDATDCTVVGCVCYDWYNNPQAQAYGIRESDTSDYNVIFGNSLRGNLTGALALVGAHTQERCNVGYLSEATGMSTIVSGYTYKTVTHGLAATPTVINISFLEQGTNDYGRWWISDVGATSFKLNVSADPGGSSLDFRWEAKIR